MRSATAGCGSRGQLSGTSSLLPPTAWVLRQNSGFHAWLQHPWLLSHLTGPPDPPFLTFPVALPLKWPPCIVKQLRWVSEPVCVLGIPPPPAMHTHSPSVKEGSSLRLLLLDSVACSYPSSPFILCSITAALELQPPSLTFPTLYIKGQPLDGVSERCPQPGCFSIASGDKIRSLPGGFGSWLVAVLQYSLGKCLA